MSYDRHSRLAGTLVMVSVFLPHKSVEDDAAYLVLLHLHLHFGVQSKQSRAAAAPNSASRPSSRMSMEEGEFFSCWPW